MTLKQKIKIELIKRGIPAAEIARKMGVTRVAIYLTIKGEIKSHRLRKAIAEAIGATVEELWPSNDNGDNPRTPFIKGDNTPLRPLSRGESERN